MTPLHTSLIISSYNQPKALALVLEAVSKQVRPVDEIIIADDGSIEPTFSVIEQCKSRFNLPIKAVITQEDRGFRKGMILNKAVLKSSGQQLLFLDGDVIPPPHWSEKHIAAYRPMGYAAGTYIKLGLAESDDVVKKGLAAWAEHASTFNRNVMLKALKAWFYVLVRHPKRPKLWGGNFSADRGLFFGVNGFDERYSGYSGLDSDIRNRMNNYGARRNALTLQTLALHLHPGVDSEKARSPDHKKSRRTTRESMYQDSKNNLWAEIGLTSHMPPTQGSELKLLS